MNHSIRTLARGIAAVAILTVGTTARAQDAASSPLSVHGYLSQGFGWSSGLPIVGVDRRGTSDYRRAALQVRYELPNDDRFVVQFGHRRVGDNIINTATSDVSLDWAFYQKDLGGLALKAGRLPLARGIYNETRDVGTVLPFWRAPYNFYTESFATIDGASVGYSHALPGRFALQGIAYAGSYDIRFATTSAQGNALLSMKADRAAGGQLWLRTPIRGARVGLGGSRFSMPEFTVTQKTTPSTGSNWYASLDVTRDHGFARGEYARFQVGGMDYDSWYAQAGLKFFDRLQVNGQVDVSEIALPTPYGFRLGYTYGRDDAVAVNYAFTPNLVLKLEGHQAKGYNFDRYVPQTGPAGQAHYYITGLAVSF